MLEIIGDTGWLIFVLYLYIMANPNYMWRYDKRLLRSKEIGKWWINTGLPVWMFLGIRAIILTIFVILYYIMTLRIKAGV